MKKKIFTFCFILIAFIYFLPSTNNFSLGKYLFEDEFDVANVNVINEKAPEFELLEINNYNTNYEKYANSTHRIHFKIRLIKNNMKTCNFNESTFKVKVGDEYVDPSFKTFSVSSDSPIERIYNINIYNITGNGPLSVIIPEGVAESTLKSQEYVFDSGIQIDNIAPVLSSIEELQSDKSSKITIISNEAVRPLDGWSQSDDKMQLSKNFPSKIFYSIKLTDLAQNSSTINIDVKQASQISLSYTSLNSEDKHITSTGSDGDTISTDGKIESILIHESSLIDDLKLQGKCFLYTPNYSSGVCIFSELKYNYGYNPNNKEWFVINTDNLLNWPTQSTTQLGGSGLNASFDTATFGISSVAFRIANNSNYSVVYQTYVDGYGWLKACADGRESVKDVRLPISKFRISIVPKSEKDNLINYWNSF